MQYTTYPCFIRFDEWLIFFVTSSRHLDSDGSSAQVSWHIAKRCRNSDTQVISRYHQFEIMFGCPPGPSQYGFDAQNLVPEITPSHNLWQRVLCLNILPINISDLPEKSQRGLHSATELASSPHLQLRGSKPWNWKWDTIWNCCRILRVHVSIYEIFMMAEDLQKTHRQNVYIYIPCGDCSSFPFLLVIVTQGWGKTQATCFDGNG